MTLNNEVSNIASIPFVAMALQTAEEINASYMRKMNRDYATYIRNPETTSIGTIAISTISISQDQISSPSGKPIHIE